MPRCICLDFDGVIRMMRWDGDCETKEPVPGAIAALQEYQQHFVVAIFSVRSGTKEGRWDMMTFLRNNGIPHDLIQWEDRLFATDGHTLGNELQPIRFPATKPSAGVFLDDRSWPAWSGQFPTVQELSEFQPWWKEVGKPSYCKL